LRRSDKKLGFSDVLAHLKPVHRFPSMKRKKDKPFDSPFEESVRFGHSGSNGSLIGTYWSICQATFAPNNSCDIAISRSNNQSIARVDFSQDRVISLEMLYSVGVKQLSCRLQRGSIDLKRRLYQRHRALNQSRIMHGTTRA
jgi:hypothetical protein